MVNNMVNNIGAVSKNTSIFIVIIALVGAIAYLILVLGINRYSLPEWAVTLAYFGVTTFGAFLLWRVHGTLGQYRDKRLVVSHGALAGDKARTTVFDRLVPNRIDACLINALSALSDAQSDPLCNSGLRNRVDVVKEALELELVERQAGRDESQIR